MCRFAELDYLVEDIYCYSEFHAPCGAIIRQLPKITDTYGDVQNLYIYIYIYIKLSNNCLLVVVVVVVVVIVVVVVLIVVIVVVVVVSVVA